MRCYIKLNKELAHEVEYLRRSLHKKQTEIIQLKREYFQERAAKVLLKRKFQCALEEVQEVCTKKCFMKIKQILQKYKKHYDCNDSDFGCDSSVKRNNRHCNVTAKPFSDTLQQSPSRISNTFDSHSDSITSTGDDALEIGWECAANAPLNNYKETQPKNLLYQENGPASVEVEDQRLYRRITMIMYEDNQETNDVAPQKTSDEASKSVCKLKNDDHCMKMPEISIKTYEKENKQPKTKIKHENQTSKVDVKSRYGCVTERRCNIISQPKVTTLKVPSPPPSLKDIHLSACRSPQFCPSEISYSIGFEFVDSLQYNGTTTIIPITTMDMTTTTNRAPLQGFDQNNMVTRPSRRCKPINLKEPSLVRKLRNDS